MKNKHGEYRWIRDIGRPFYDLDNEFLGYIGSCYDITENKKNELRLFELNATKDKFFSLIGHDLKNPINSIVGLSNLLLKKIQQNNQNNIPVLAESIYESSQKVMHLLMQLLDWARVNGGTMDFHPTKCSLNQIVLDNISLLKETAEIKGLELVFETNDVIDLFVDVDMTNAVFRNLISNAIKYSHPGGKIWISCQLLNDACEIAIKDEGVGISEEDIEKLFRIEHAHSTLGTQNEKGSGLGLLLCKEYVQLHGSQITVESVSGKGTSFYFKMPLYKQ
jgi:signal transduction histidine kinase